MTEAEFRSLYEQLRAQVPWGPDDLFAAERGP